MRVMFNKGASQAPAFLDVRLPHALGPAGPRLRLQHFYLLLGGIMARFCVGDVYFTVITSHLAAHEGLTYRERRNADMRDILRATSAVRRLRHPAGVNQLHVKWT